jgi:hypothetical protein
LHIIIHLKLHFYQFFKDISSLIQENIILLKTKNHKVFIFQDNLIKPLQLYDAINFSHRDLKYILCLALDILLCIKLLII